MKKKMLAIVSTAALFMSVACHKHEEYPRHDDDLRGQLKEMVYNSQGNSPRHYVFYYDRQGLVDSVVASDAFNHYTYRVVRTNKRIDSVSLVQDGRIVSTNKDVQYDNANRIIYYAYDLRLDPPFIPPVTTYIAYDEQGNKHEISEQPIDSPHTGIILTYDNVHNVVTWNDRGSDVANFTYDTGLNPLYYIEDLFVIFTEEKFIWEYAFSKHNSTSKTRVSGLGTSDATFQNIYDARNRLTKKIVNDASKSAATFEFYYFP